MQSIGNQFFPILKSNCGAVGICLTFRVRLFCTELTLDRPCADRLKLTLECHRTAVSRVIELPPPIVVIQILDAVDQRRACASTNVHRRAHILENGHYGRLATENLRIQSPRHSARPAGRRSKVGRLTTVSRVFEGASTTSLPFRQRVFRRRSPFHQVSWNEFDDGLSVQRSQNQRRLPTGRP